MSKGKIIKFLTKLVILIETLLCIKFVFRFLGANPKAYIVKFFYWLSEPLIIWFKGIFEDVSFEGGVIDLVVLTAMVGYFVIFVILKKIID